MIFMGGDHLLFLQVRPQEFPQGTLHNLRTVSGSGLLRYLDNSEDSYFCESAVDFTLEETAKLVGKV